MISKKYFSVIKIPSDFTSNINKVSSKDRENINIYYSPNLKTSYLIAQFTNQAVKEIASELKLEIATTAVEELSKSVTTTFDETKKISSGFGTIANGTYSVSYGANKLAYGTKYLDDKYIEFNEGIRDVKNGSNEINDKTSELVLGVKELDDGISLLTLKVEQGTALFTPEVMTQLNVALEKTDGAIVELTNTNNAFNAGYGLLSNVIKSLAVNNILNNDNISYSNISVACNDNLEVVNNIMQTAGQSSFGSSEICLSKFNSIKVGYDNEQDKHYNEKLITLLNGDKVALEKLISVAGSMNELNAGVSRLNKGSDDLLDGTLKLETGINSLNSGINRISSYSDTISSGIDSVNNGTKSLAEGSKKLNSGVKDAKDAIDSKIDSNEKKVSDLDGLSDYTKGSVKVKQNDYGKVNDYGTFFAPYFMSLSLWVGGLLILMGLYYDPEKRFNILCKETSSRGKRLLFYNIIGICQAIILAFILKLLLGFEVTNIWLFYGTCILISDVFLSIIMFLFFNFKDIGKFLALLFLIIQLASCGGTFPIQTEPGFYKFVYPFMPMTYSVDLLRESFVNINSSFLVKDVIILSSILVVFTLLTLFTSLIKNRKELKDRIDTKIENKKKKNKNKKSVEKKNKK